MRSKEQGFTFIEVLAVLSIIAIASLGTLVLRDWAVGNARVSEAKNLITTLQAGAQMWKPASGEFTGISMTELSSIGAVPAVLVSATPSLETVANVQTGRYERLHLADRHGSAGLPAIEVIDLRTEVLERGRWLAAPVVEAVAAALGAKKQALLFLNRRGYAPLALCRACGYRIQCPNCQAWLVEHRIVGRLECHHCGHTVPRPPACPMCEAEDSLVACGPGVERLHIKRVRPDSRSSW